MFCNRVVEFITEKDLVTVVVVAAEVVVVAAVAVVGVDPEWEI